MRKFQSYKIEPLAPENISLSQHRKSIVGFSVRAYHLLENDIHVFVSPSFSVSGYGKSKEDAEQSFRENLNLFIDDYNNSTNLVQKTNHLQELGWLIGPNHSNIRYTPKNTMHEIMDNFHAQYTYA